MRSENGMHFDNCVGLQDKSSIDGSIFTANVLTCHDKALNPGESILVGGRAYRYHGDDNLGYSHFTALEPFPEPEIVERLYRDNLFVVLEIYSMRNGHFYVWPYIQSGSSSSGNYTRQAFRFKGEFETREAAVEAGWTASKEHLDTLYSPY